MRPVSFIETGTSFCSVEQWKSHWMLFLTADLGSLVLKSQTRPSVLSPFCHFSLVTCFTCSLLRPTVRQDPAWQTSLCLCLQTSCCNKPRTIAQNGCQTALIHRWERFTRVKHRWSLFVTLIYNVSSTLAGGVSALSARHSLTRSGAQIPLLPQIIHHPAMSLPLFLSQLTCSIELISMNTKS